MQKPAPFFRGLLAHRREMRRSTAGATSIETSNNIFNEVLCQAMADLNMLMTETPQGRYPYAGIPWYSTTFGRDGLITALQMLWVDPRIAQGVLKRLAFFQAKTVDPLADAEPGKILHEMRGGEMAALREVPFAQYYGSVDSTPLFVLLAGLYFERTGDEETLAELWPAIEAALRLDRRPRRSRSATALSNISARPSRGSPTRAGRIRSTRSSMPTARLAEGYIALAKCRATSLPPSGWPRAARGALGLRTRRASSRPKRERLRRALRGGVLVRGTRHLRAGARWRQAAVPGAHLECRAAAVHRHRREDRARLVARRSDEPHFFSGWGIRTVAQGEARYNPMSYHDGSIWPHDNALIALGFARYGLKHSVAHLFKGLFDAASYMDLRRLPELFCGFQRERRRGPMLYPVACAPQAWASATPFTLLEAALGLEFDAARGEIRLRNPRLPEFLNEVVLRDLRLGASSVDLRVRRHGDEVSLEVLRTRGQIQVSIVLTH